MLPRISPNVLTFASLASGVAWAEGGPPALALASIALDEIDGRYARATGQVTERGGLFDWGGDVVLSALTLRRLGGSWAIPFTTFGQVALRADGWRPPVGSLRAALMLYALATTGASSSTPRREVAMATGLSTFGGAPKSMFKNVGVAGLSGAAYFTLSNGFVESQFASSPNAETLRALLQAFLGVAVAWVTWKKAPMFAAGVAIAGIVGGGYRFARAQGWTMTVARWFQPAAQTPQVPANERALYDRVAALVDSQRDAAIAALSPADRALYQHAVSLLGAPPPRAGALAGSNYTDARYRAPAQRAAA